MIISRITTAYTRNWRTTMMKAVTTMTAIGTTRRRRTGTRKMMKTME